MQPWTLSRSTRVAALIITFVAAPAMHAQGLSYDINTTGTGTDPRSGAAMTRTYMAGHGQFTSGMSRIDFTQSLAQGGMMGAGTYMISNAAKGTTTIVDPAKHEYIELNPGELAKTAAGLQQSLGGMMKQELTDLKVSLDELGAGEAIEGYGTLKYRLTESYTMKISIMGRATESTEHSTTDIWVAPQLDGIMFPTARPASVAATGPMAELTTEIGKAYAKVKKGVVLKSVRTSENVSGSKTRATTITTTITGVKRVAISPSVFEVPAGYTKGASALDALSPLGGVADSLKAARARDAKKRGSNDDASADGTRVDSAQGGIAKGIADEAKTAGQDEAKAKVNKALGKIFGRPQQ